MSKQKQSDLADLIKRYIKANQGKKDEKSGGDKNKKNIYSANNSDKFIIRDSTKFSFTPERVKRSKNDSCMKNNKRKSNISIDKTKKRRASSSVKVKNTRNEKINKENGAKNKRKNNNSPNIQKLNKNKEVLANGSTKIIPLNESEDDNSDNSIKSCIDLKKCQKSNNEIKVKNKTKTRNSANNEYIDECDSSLQKDKKKKSGKRNKNNIKYKHNNNLNYDKNAIIIQSINNNKSVDSLIESSYNAGKIKLTSTNKYTKENNIINPELLGNKKYMPNDNINQEMLNYKSLNINNNLLSNNAFIYQIIKENTIIYQIFENEMLRHFYEKMSSMKESKNNKDDAVEPFLNSLINIYGIDAIFKALKCKMIEKRLIKENEI